MATEDLLKVFPNYIKVFRQVCDEYDRTPEWRMVRKHLLLRKMHKINCDYVKWFEREIDGNKK